jgi:hypothetical protein
LKSFGDIFETRSSLLFLNESENWA